MNNEIIEELVRQIAALEKRLEYLETVEKNAFSTVTVNGTANIKDALTVDTDGRIYQKERAAAGADYATYGQLCVKNTDPCELWFTSDTGVDTKLA